MTGSDADASVGDGDVPPPVTDFLDALGERIASRKRLLLCLDFDGTLAPIVDDPAEATVPESTRRALERVVDRGPVDVAIVSGRSLRDLRARVDVGDVALAGNHGLEIERESDVWVHPAVERYRGELERVSTDLERRLASLPGCYLEDKGVTATVHYRRASPDDAREARALVERAVANADGLEIGEGKKILEIRPAIEWGKGAAVRNLMDDDRDALTVYVGDDVTDEDVFREFTDTDHVGVAVTDRPSAADYRVRDPDEVRELLEWFATVDVGGTTEGDRARR